MTAVPCADCGHTAVHDPDGGCMSLETYCPCPVFVPSLPAVVSSPTLERARLERDAAVAQVEENADAEWLATTTAQVGILAATGEPFDVDDVWGYLAARSIPAPREPRAMGPVLKAAVRAGTIRWTGDYRPSARRHCAPIRVYVGTGT